MLYAGGTSISMGWRDGYNFSGRMGGTRGGILKHKLQEAEVTYADLAKRPKKHGFNDETEALVTNKKSEGRSRPLGFSLCLRHWNWTA
jgi:hypothetical protein